MATQLIKTPLPLTQYLMPATISIIALHQPQTRLFMAASRFLFHLTRPGKDRHRPMKVLVDSNLPTYQPGRTLGLLRRYPSLNGAGAGELTRWLQIPERSKSRTSNYLCIPLSTGGGELAGHRIALEEVHQVQRRGFTQCSATEY